MTSPTPTVPAADLLRVIAECADEASHCPWINSGVRSAFASFAEALRSRASPPRGGDGAGLELCMCPAGECYRDGVAEDMRASLPYHCRHEAAPLPPAAEAGEPTLLPCPFCGTAPMFLEYATLHFVGCHNCGCEGPHDSTGRDAAARHWNTRRAQPIPGAGEGRDLANGLREWADQEPNCTTDFGKKLLNDAAALLDRLSSSPPATGEVGGLVEKLRLVPKTVSTAGKNGVHCAVGEWCHEAADELDRLSSPPPATGEVGAQDQPAVRALTELAVARDERNAWQERAESAEAALATAREEIEAATATLEDEQAAHRDTLRLLAERTTSLDQARAALEAQTRALKKAAGWFREYADGHSAKHTTDGDEKAQRNLARAIELEQSIPAAPPSEGGRT